MSKKQPSLTDILDRLDRRFDNLEQKLVPVLESVGQEEYLPLDKLPFPAGTARKYIYAGKLSATRIGKRLYVKKSELATFIQNMPRKGRKPKSVSTLDSTQRMSVGNRLSGVQKQGVKRE